MTPYKLQQTYCEEYYENCHSMTPKFWEELNSVIPYLRGCDTVLDMGTGTGRVPEVLNSQGFRAVGIDASPIAQYLAERRGRDVFERDACGTLLPDNAYDAVTSLHLLEHLREPHRAIAESVRLSRRVAIHLVPLGYRMDPTHVQQYNTIEPLLEESFGRQVDWFESVREDGKRYGAIILRAVQGEQ